MYHLMLSLGQVKVRRALHEMGPNGQSPVRANTERLFILFFYHSASPYSVAMSDLEVKQFIIISHFQFMIYNNYYNIQSRNILELFSQQHSYSIISGCLYVIPLKVVIKVTLCILELSHHIQTNCLKSRYYIESIATI